MSASVTVQAEWSSLTMGVSLTELGAFKHDDSYFRASRRGRLPIPPSLPVCGIWRHAWEELSITAYCCVKGR